MDNVSFPVTPSTTQGAHVNQRITPSTTRETHVVQRITPPRFLRQQVEDEDVDSDDEDEGEQRESDTAPQDNVGGNQEEPASGAEAPQLGRGHRMRTQPDYYQADHTNIRHAYRNKADVIHTCFQGAGYGVKTNAKLKEGFINVTAQIDSLIDENPPPVELTEEQLDEHIM